MAALTGLFLFVGFLIGGETGMVMRSCSRPEPICSPIGIPTRCCCRMYGAREVDEATRARLVHLVRQLAGQAGLPMPKVYIVENDQPNAFATGRNPEHAAVCVTSGLLARVNSEELAGVLAHELSHVKHRDTLTMTITATIAGAVSMLANFAFFFGGGRRNGPLGFVGHAAGDRSWRRSPPMLVQMAISRTREFEADGRARRFRAGRSGWPRRSRRSIAHARMRSTISKRDANPATAHMFIINPLHGGGLSGLFSSHPSTEERIARLQRHGGTDRGAARALGVSERSACRRAPAAQADSVRGAAQAAAARCGARGACAICRSARCRICARHRRRDPAPLRPDRSADPALRAEAAAAAQIRPDTGNPARGRLRIAVSGRARRMPPSMPPTGWRRPTTRRCISSR